MEQLQRRQAAGELRVRTSAEFRADVATVGLQKAFSRTDVLAAGGCSVSTQASLNIGPGPCDPPIRIQRAELGGVRLQCHGSNNSLTMPLGGGDRPEHSGATVLNALLKGASVPFVASGEKQPQFPRQELVTQVDLAGLGMTRLLLPRAISENGIVAVNSGETRIWSFHGPLLERLGNAVFTAPGGRGIGLSSPRLHCLGAGSPVFVAGAVGVVTGAGIGHQPRCKRLPGDHALAPGAVAAVSADAEHMNPAWLRPCWFGELGAGVMVALAAPVPLLTVETAAPAGCGDHQLQAPVLDFSIPRRVRPVLGCVSYKDLLGGRITVKGHAVPTASATSLRLTDHVTAALAEKLRDGSFPLVAPFQPLPEKPTLTPVNS
ncbi:MAG: hypothetical protein F4Z75_04155 [Synechococcus sp. SB0668_bin_15]|nr:hypothetical protein [Synechococcus sp. SB0668_bin_15]MXZ83473.1 hypothetical protein [Synechococcus sp. SB0666_bin_14]MYA91011.1 hypothetical protein [Synechococcus sp. SB0663_bin_10]MYC49241.1 hypothetical protein [Synechococcus sp. SB0662_bin_14]MYG47229.1 hypothetical protein [Synechococcus sp. SB0675_bin_6]MYJ60587.1 hypothetical protein [Synechococcus sp. SB0672_bin_6]MYK91931.1 hypothetical protein [Synechococcus sp. SB0669_bin_8]